MNEVSGAIQLTESITGDLVWYPIKRIQSWYVDPKNDKGSVIELVLLNEDGEETLLEEKVTESHLVVALRYGRAK